MNIAVLDAGTLGDDIELSMLDKFGKVSVYQKTAVDEVAQRIKDCEAVILNKIKLNEKNLAGAKKLKIICITATGFDNVDTAYCRAKGIAVCNVKGYSTNSVAQLTSAIVLSLVNHLNVFDAYVKDGSYTKSGVQNRLTPVFHELAGQTWGIIGLGGIGRKTAEIAKALGCKVIGFKRNPEPGYKCVSLQELCKRSDIISIHLPLSEETKGIVSEAMIALMKKNAIVVNMARGAVIDESAITEAVLAGRIGGFGTDVYSVEPMTADSPFNRLVNMDNVIFTPHMAWGAYETRIRCMEEIALNIDAYLKGEMRNRVEL